MNRVDKITAILLGICLLVVGFLVATHAIEGNAALGFISGVGVALVGNGTARAVDSRNKSKNSSNE